MLNKIEYYSMQKLCAEQSDLVNGKNHLALSPDFPSQCRRLICVPTIHYQQEIAIVDRVRKHKCFDYPYVIRSFTFSQWSFALLNMCCFLPAGYPGNF